MRIIRDIEEKEEILRNQDKVANSINADVSSEDAHKDLEEATFELQGSNEPAAEKEEEVQSEIAAEEVEDLSKKEVKKIDKYRGFGNGGVPIDPEDLPSKGKSYNSALLAKKLTAIQIKELSRINRDNVDRIVDNILSKNILGMDYKQLKKADKLWLVYFLRAITYEDYPYRVRGECDSCEEKAWFDYTLDNLLVTYYSGEIDDLTLPNGDVLSFKFPTIADEHEATAIKNNPGYIENIDTEIMGTADFINKINGKKVTLYEAYGYFVRGRGSAMDYAHFLSHLKDRVYGCRPIASTTCPHCGSGKLYAEVNLEPNFFLPNVK